MKKLSLLYCVAAMLLSACANDPAETPQMDARAVVFEASNPAGESRTEIDGLNILWQSNDAVGLFSPQIGAAKNRRIVVEDQYAGQSRAVLKSDLRYANETDDHTFYAYYPYAEGQTDYTRVEGTIATQQDGTISKSAFMWASKTVKPSDTPVGLQFQHPFAYIDIQVGTSSLYAGATVKEVRLKAADGKVLSGKFRADLTSGAVTFTKPVNEVAASTNHVLDNYFRHVGYMVVNAEDLTGTTVDVYVTVSQDGQDITFRTTKNGRQFNPQSKVQLQLNVAVMTDVGREDRERQALIAIYNALNGDNWTNNQNWCSDKPLSEWSGVTVHSDGYNNAGSVCKLNLSGGVSGTLPEEVGQLTNLQEITIHGLSGFSTALYDCSQLRYIFFNMPNNCSWSYEGIGKLSELLSLTFFSPGSQTPLSAEVGQCTKLQTLQVRGSGSLPKELGNLTDLRRVWISNSNFSGELPAELGNCTNLEELDLHNNNFTGRIPDGIVQNENLWRYCWAYIVQGNSFDLSGTEIPAEKFTVTGIDGETIDAAQIYASNEYTLLYQFAPGYSSNNAENVKSLYERYKDKKLGVIGYTSSLINGSTEESVRTFVSNYGIEWPTFLWNMNDGTNLILPKKDGWTHAAFYPYDDAPAYTLVDKNGKVVCYDFDRNLKTINNFITLKLGESAYYQSTDYSQDGQVLALQTATVGQGIDLVFMGEGFTDKDMDAGGKYEAKMQEAVEQFFAYEPYKTFRNRFNAYVVKAVSPNAEFEEGAVHVFDQSDKKAFEYAQKVPGINTSHKYVNIIYNTLGSAGRSYTAMYGDGSYVSYNMEGVNNVLNHEACGHGFAKLADEYVEPGSENTVFTATADLDERHDAGWYVNVDYRNDPSSVRWSRLLNDPRYRDEGLGLYEGAFTYGLGCYRPTENSMMRYNNFPFNAPSREHIYKRIMSESEGEGWQYDYEAFVAYDEVSRNANLRTPLAVHPNVMRPANHRPPVVVKGTWRDAK